MELDLNCDLGEGEPIARSRGLMQWITSANIACGGHAGDLETMEACVALAWDHGVHLGAHPGLPDKKNLGRKELDITPVELKTLLVQQVGGFEKILHSHGLELHHVKLHGALYHQVEDNRLLAKAYLEVMRQYFPGVILYAFSGGVVSKMAGRYLVPVFEEVFMDRAYRKNRKLVPREEAGAVLASASAIAERARHYLTFRRMPCREGGWVALEADTMCVHGDTQDALDAVRLLRTMVEADLSD